VWLIADGTQVLEKVKRRELALVQYDEACELDPRSTKARFAKARVLLVLHRPKEAFMELDLLKSMEPDDAKVHYLLGRVYKALGERTAALRHFTIAMNLDPKVRLCLHLPPACTDRLQATNHIKESLEALEESDDDMDADDMD
jgi:anaphase-promoting complex subunit 3